MGKLTAEVEAFAKARKLWDIGNSILVACSGGQDSMTLLSVLLEICKLNGRNIHVAAAHYHHGIRGIDADHDADYVQRFCEKHGIPFYLGKGDVPAYSEQHHLSLETAARKLRYEFLYETAKKIGASRIAVAHHADDQAETVMMRILRGTGIHGLAAIRPKNGIIIRPLLFASRSAIEDYCRAHQIDACHDSTNDVPDAERNRLRLELFPLLKKEYNPSIRDVLCRLASVAADNDDFLEELVRKNWTDVVLQESNTQIVFSSAAMRPLSRTLRMELLRVAVQMLGGQRSVSFVQYEAIEALFHGGHTGKIVNLPEGMYASASAKEVLLMTERPKKTVWNSQILRIPGETRIEELGVTIVARRAYADEIVQGRLEVLLLEDYLKDAVVRHRRNGDRFAMGAGSQSVKKLLIDRKVPRENRDEVPLIVSREKILWVAGIRQADIGRPQKGKTAVHLQLKYDKTPKWLK